MKGRSALAVTVIAVAVLAPATAGAGEDEVPDDRARVSFTQAVVDEDGQLWLKVGFYVPWDPKPPTDLFSLFFSLTVQVGDETAVVGWQVHDGVPETLGETPAAYILENGCVLVATGLHPSGDYTVDIEAEFGSWEDENTTAAVFGSETMSTGSEFVDSGDPFATFGKPVFDLVGGEMVATTPTTAAATTSGPTTTEVSVTTIDSGTVIDGDGGLPWFLWILLLIFAFGILYVLLVHVLEWWRPPWVGPRYAYRVGVDVGVVEEVDEDGDDRETGEGDTKTDTDTTGTGEDTTGTDATRETEDDDDTAGGAPAVFEDREPTKRDCSKLRAECERLKVDAAQARLEAERAREVAVQAEADCTRARERIAELEQRVEDLDSREDAPQRYLRLAEAQQALRDAQAGLDEVCDAVEPARQAAEQAEAAARDASHAADEACRKAEECEAAQ